jgi:hypothetical protein
MLDRRECAVTTSGKRKRTFRAGGSGLWAADKPLGGASMGSTRLPHKGPFLSEHRKRFCRAHGTGVSNDAGSRIRGPMNIFEPNDFTTEQTRSPGLLLKVSLDHAKGQIWRNLLVPANAHLGWIHAVIQVSMGWTNSHLHQFTFKDKTFSDPSFDLYDPMTIDERKCALNKLLIKPGDSIRYEYDFGDSWQHTLSLIQTETTTLPELATCVEGAGACPPEDCGGIQGYRDLLRAMKKPESTAAMDFTEWLGHSYNPNHFDRDSVNRSLEKLPWPSVSEAALRKAIRGRLKRKTKRIQS